jgi:hypothetical protein
MFRICTVSGSDRVPLQCSLRRDFEIANLKPLREIDARVRVLAFKDMVSLAKVDQLSGCRSDCYCSHPPYLGCSDQVICSKRKIVHGVN